MSATTAYPNYSPGLEGVIAGISTISEIDSDRSSLIYRGIDVHELAEHGSFEETAYLLLYGKLPNRDELRQFKQVLSDERDVPEPVYEALRQTPRNAHPMDALKVAYSILAPFDPDYENNDHDANVRKAVRILAKAGTIVANGYRIKQGKDIVKPDANLSIAGNFLYILHGGEQPDEFTEKVMDASLTLYAEHGFNASTFACRVTVSTLSDIYSGIVTGIGTLKGPLHGGANEEAMKMLQEVGSPDKAEEWVRDALANKKKIMGFGHREYKKGDSRAFYMTRIGKEIGRRKGNTTWGDIADIMERVMLEEKGLYPNVDFPAAYAYYLLGIPIELYTPIFVMARVSGWSAHAIEQLDNNRLIRPKQIYEGPAHAEFVALDGR
jgi:2-methylcitrate synthase/citrate synthase II